MPAVVDDILVLSVATINNKLLVQFDMFRPEGECTWEQLEELMLKILPPFINNINTEGLY